jgi:uncharacterized protein YjbI with pentapeptide repeats/endonuclease YncB( thermonuclease family)
MLKPLLWIAAVLTPPAAFLFGRFIAHAGWPIALLFAVVAAVAVFLASQAETTKDKAAELGRGLLVSIVLTIAVGWIQHQTDVRTARESLALTLSSGKDLAGIDLDGRNLTGFYIADKDLSEADLQKADLHGATLVGSTLRGANLSHADLKQANLFGADLTQSSTRHLFVNLVAANLEQATLSTAKLKGANLAGADLEGANLSGTDLRYADLRQTNLRGAFLPGADLRGAFLDRADLSGAIFETDLRRAQLDDVALLGARWNSKTRWPAGFKPADEIAKAERTIPPPPIPADAHSDHVIRIVDGDTLILNTRQAVRLLGINAPQAEPPECYGTQATTDLARLLSVGQAVQYTLGKRQPIDKYGRALAYLWLPSGTFVNQLTVDRGDARVFISQKGPYDQTLRAAEVRSEMHRSGIWRACPVVPD